MPEKRIFTYQLKTKPVEQVLEVHTGGQFLAAIWEAGSISLFFQEDHERARELRAFAVVPTGSLVPLGYSAYRGTVLNLGEKLLALHIYEAIEL